MTEMTGKEPKHWHNDSGRHRMPDPRGQSIPLRHLSRDEQDYAAHLARHEADQECPDRLPGDHESIVALFDLIDSRFAEIRKMRLLIIGLRQKFAQAPERDDLEHS